MITGPLVCEPLESGAARCVPLETSVARCGSPESGAVHCGPLETSTAHYESPEAPVIYTVEVPVTITRVYDEPSETWVYHYEPQETRVYPYEPPESITAHCEPTSPCREDVRPRVLFLTGRFQCLSDDLVQDSPAIFATTVAYYTSSQSKATATSIPDILQYIFYYLVRDPLGEVPCNAQISITTDHPQAPSSFESGF